MAKFLTHIIVLMSVLATGPGVLGRQEKIRVKVEEGPQSEHPEFANDAGWSWLMPPQPVRLGRTFGIAREDCLMTGYCVVDAEGGLLRLFFVQAGAGLVETPGHRLVVLDAEGNRYLPERDDAGGSGNQETSLHRALYSLDPKVLEPAKVAYVGAERREAGAP